MSAARTLSTRRRPIWVAHEPDGVAHAQLAGSLRTPCGRIPVAERFGYALRVRCATCVEALGLAGAPR